MVAKKNSTKSAKTPKTASGVKSIEQLAKSQSSFGDFIAEIRERQDVTQVQFAKTLGISKQNLCDIERGRRSIGAKVASDIAKKLKFAPSHFVRLALQDMLKREGVNVKVDIH